MNNETRMQVAPNSGESGYGWVTLLTRRVVTRGGQVNDGQARDSGHRKS
ncbi:hypothetical protein RESH_00347 [Rhodopirellula europaea SH398]|uniref:Uncharacterized protein n=1 Tax=Rhodopirellula europaea SH398 TaxID=1263868 RepID=M5SMS4_9BACT|nr:hypothetical protein RESH_00347 [Rhodopirellula europaea SH398]